LSVVLLSASEWRCRIVFADLDGKLRVILDVVPSQHALRASDVIDASKSRTESTTRILKDRGWEKVVSLPLAWQHASIKRAIRTWMDHIQPARINPCASVTTCTCGRPIASNGHVPKECLTEHDGCIVILHKLGKLWRLRHRNRLQTWWMRDFLRSSAERRKKAGHERESVSKCGAHRGFLRGRCRERHRAMVWVCEYVEAHRRWLADADQVSIRQIDRAGVTSGDGGLTGWNLHQWLCGG
jgi:hypothetical protein